MSVICYMSVIRLVLGGVVRVRLYAIYAHLCNHMLLRSGGGTWGTALYTVRGVGSGSRDVDAWRADVSVRRGSGAPDADGPGACLSQPLGVGVDSLVFIHLIPRIDHKIRMVINRLNHHRIRKLLVY